MAYLTRDEYVQLGGDPNAVAAFPLYEAKAAQLIDRATHGRVRDEAPVRDAVKYCAVELINALHTADQHAGREVASVSNDGVSVSYAASGGNTSEVGQRYLQIIRCWLGCETTAGGVMLLYAGVDA